MRGILIGLAVLLAAVAFLLWAPEWMANQYRFDNTKDWAAQVAANRTTLVNLLAGFAVGVTVYFTYQNFKVAQDNLSIAQGNLKITQDKLTSETFSKAVEQLGAEATSTRLGGIFTLARLAKQSESDYFPAMQILTGFLRGRPYAAATPPEATKPGASLCPVDVQAILTIVGERYHPDPPGYSLDLSFIDVRDAWLPGADFSGIFFWQARLCQVQFDGAKLSGADFTGAELDKCDFSGADLTGANFRDARITKPSGLTKAQLSPAENVPEGLALPS